MCHAQGRHARRQRELRGRRLQRAPQPQQPMLPCAAGDLCPGVGGGAPHGRAAVPAGAGLARRRRQVLLPGADAVQGARVGLPRRALPLRHQVAPGLRGEDGTWRRHRAEQDMGVFAQHHQVRGAAR